MEHPGGARWLLASQAATLTIPGVTIPGLQNATGGSGNLCKYSTNAGWFNATWESLNCIDTYKVDSQVVTNMVASAVVGFLCLGLFCVLQTFVSVYRGRLLSPQVAIKPPLYTKQGIAKYFYWMWVTLMLPEKELLATAGMDALMFERLIVFGLQFMAPITVISLAVLLPIHTHSKFMTKDQAQTIAATNLMSLTMGNLDRGAKTMWVHFCLVYLFTAYGMWLLEQHYKAYVLLRQQYLTKGDSISTWLHQKTPKQQPLTSYGSKLEDLPFPTEEELLQPTWTFASCKPSDDGNGPPGKSYVSSKAGGGKNEVTSALDLCAVDGSSSLISSRTGAHQQQQQASQQLAAHELSDLRQSPVPSSHPSLPGVHVRRPSSASGSGAISPFASPQQQQQQQQQQQTCTARGLELADLSSIWSTSDAAADRLPHTQTGPTLGTASASGAAAAAAQQGAAPAGPSEVSSPADSTMVSRQSSGRPLLAAGMASSSRHQLLEAPSGSQQDGTVAAAAAAPAGETDIESGLASPHEPNTHGSRGKLGGLRRVISRKVVGWRGCSWRRISRASSYSDNGSAEDGAAVVAVTEEEDEQLRRERQQAAAAAAKLLGADVQWRQFKTGDPLLDRHMQDVDIDAELAHDAEQKKYQPTLQRWWEFGAPERSSTAGGPAAAANCSTSTWDAAGAAAPTYSSSGAGSSNIVPVPGMNLLFDKRSLLARKPSVRFRNTVHVLGINDNVVPLHVSNYAVLVTDVPNPPSRDSDGGSSMDECIPYEGLCGPWLCACRQLLGLLERLLWALVWSWPCLWTGEDFQKHSCDWTHRSLHSTHSMQLNREAAAAVRRAGEAGGLLADEEEDEQQQQVAAGAGRAHSGRRPTRQLTGVALSRADMTRDRLVELTFRHLFPGDVQAVIPAKNFKAVNNLLREWNNELMAYIHAIALKKQRDHKRQRDKAAAIAAAAAAGTGSNAPVLNGSSSVACSKQQQLQQEEGQQHSGSGGHVNGSMELYEVSLDVTTFQAAVDGGASTTAALAAADTASIGVSITGLEGTNGSCGESSSRHQAGQAEACSSSPSLDAPRPQPAFSDSSTPQPRPVSVYDDDDSSLPCQDCCACILSKLDGCSCCRRAGAMQDRGDGIAARKYDESGISGSGSRRFWHGSRSGGGAEQNSQDGSHKEAERLKEWAKKIVAMEERILALQQEVVRDGPDTGAYIVLFKTPQAATLAANSAVYPPTKNSLEAFKVQPAPSPEDLCWPALWTSPAERRSVLPGCVFWYALLYAVPTGIFTAALNSVSVGLCSNPELLPRFYWFCNSALLKFIVTIVAPFILLMVWQNAVIPAQLYRLELKRASAVSLSQMERSILFIYCGWELINLFLGGVMGGSLVSQLKMIIEHPEQWATLLGAAIPQTSNFFLNYVITRAFLMNFVRLLMPHGGMWRWIGQMLFTGLTGFRHVVTPAYRARIIYPASIRYGREPGLVLLILLMGTAYSVAAPLITPFTLAYLATAYLVWRYQMLYVCVRCYESGGKMWPVYFVCINWCLGFFVAMTSSMFLFKQANIQGILVLLLLPVLYWFARRCRYRYSSRVDSPPLWLVHDAPRTEINPLVYTPPALQPNVQGWFFEAGKAWVRWGVPPYSNPKSTDNNVKDC